MNTDYLIYIQEIVAKYGYISVFIFMLLENVLILGLLVPGTIVLIVAGFYAGSKNFLDHNLLIILGFLGTIIGDNISFFIGKYLLSKLNFLNHWLIEIDRQR